MNKIIRLDQAAGLIPDGSTISISGAWMLVPDSILKAVGQSFQRTGHPRQLSATFALCPGGTADQPGIEHLAQPGQLRRVIGGSFPNLAQSSLRQLIADGVIEAYNLPAGMIATWYREVGAGRPGAISRRGLGTFVDPRLEGGRMNGACMGDIVSIIELNGEEHLFFPSSKVNVSIIRATTADEAGNLTMEHEPATSTAFVQAMAARASGGKVIAQVERVVPSGTLNPHHVKVPGCLVDYVAVDSSALQASGIPFDPSLCGEVRMPLSPAHAGSAAERRIAQRALQEIRDSDLIVLGYGISALVPYLLVEMGQFSKATFAIEQGSIGGLPLTDFGFGSSVNPSCILDVASQFDLFQGGCHDQAMLSFLQVDSKGRVNVHKIDARPNLSAGIGGFLDIAASARKLLFLGFFTAGEGKVKKFVNRLDHISFDPRHSRAEEILYITERAVFRQAGDRLALIEVSPGVDVQRDVLSQMDFEPCLDQVKVTLSGTTV